MIIATLHLLICLLQAKCSRKRNWFPQSNWIDTWFSLTFVVIIFLSLSHCSRLIATVHPRLKRTWVVKRLEKTVYHIVSHVPLLFILVFCHSTMNVTLCTFFILLVQTVYCLFWEFLYNVSVCSVSLLGRLCPVIYHIFSTLL